MDTTAIRSKIKALEALADSGRKSTPEHERAAAVRMLERFRALLAEQTGTHSAGVADYRWYGERYADTQRLDLVDVAKLIRAEIKLARKIAKVAAVPGAVKVADPIGDAPAEVKIGVRTQYYAGGGAIDVTIKNIPAAWGWTEVPDDSYYDQRPRKVPTEALRALARAVKAVMDSYNYDGSDAMTDYFDKRFYGGVSADGLGRLA